MKITEKQLRNIIKESIQGVLREYNDLSQSDWDYLIHNAYDGEYSRGSKVDYTTKQEYNDMYEDIYMRIQQAFKDTYGDVQGLTLELVTPYKKYDGEVSLWYTAKPKKMAKELHNTLKEGFDTFTQNLDKMGLPIRKIVELNDEHFAYGTVMMVHLATTDFIKKFLRIKYLNSMDPDF